MPTKPADPVRDIFAHINGLVRAAGLYPAAHLQTQRAKETLLEALRRHLDAHGTLAYRFLGGVLVANDRILSRESLVYHRLLEVCQKERRIGSITFRAGVEPREIDALLEALTEGMVPDAPAWHGEKALVHIFLGPPVEPDKQGGEAVARRAYYGSIEALREIEVTIRSREPISVEQIGTLRILTSALLEQILKTPGLVVRLASIKSYDEYTLYHSVNVAVISIGLGVVIGLPPGLLRDVGMAGMLHDLGKIAIPPEVLRKPGPLNEQEWRIMRWHPVLGADLLSRMPGSNRLPMIVAFEHHMRFDMRGYPVPTEGWVQHPVSRLACVADVFDAMTSRRSYKQAIPTEAVCAYVRSEADRIFDPRFAGLLEQLLAELRRESRAEGAA